jgi:hypothetical protein
MFDAFSSTSNRIKTLVFLGVCILAGIAAVRIGIDDNPAGVLLAFLAAAAFVLAFVHPWRTARKFIFLLLGSVLGFVLFIILNIITDSVVQSPTRFGALGNLIQSPAVETLNLIFAMLCPAVFFVGAAGWLVMLIRGRRQQS